MPTTNIQPLPRMRGREEYVALGKGEAYRENKANGTTRAVFEINDLGDREAFIRYAEEHCTSRKYEGYEVRFSWSKDELDPSDPEAHRIAGEHAYEACSRMYPGCLLHVTVHNDGEGGCVHAHAEVANHVMVGGVVGEKPSRGKLVEFESIEGQCIRENRSHRCVKAVSDELAREQGMRVVEQEGKVPSWDVQRQVVEQKLEDAEANGQAKRTITGLRSDLVIGDAVNRVYTSDGWSSADEYRARLLDAGIDVVEGKDGGWTYRMDVELDGKTRKRRAKASRLSDDFTREGVEREADARHKAAEVPQKSVEAMQEPAGAAVPAGAPAAHQQAPAPLVEMPETPDVDEIEENLGELFKQTRARNTVGSGGKYVALNREMEGLLAEYGRDGLARMRDEWDVQAKAEVEEIERRKREQKKLKERTTAEEVCGSVADRLMRDAKRNNDFFALLLGMLFKMEQERLRQKRLLQLKESQRKEQETRRQKWDTENREKAATKTLERFDKWADAREERMAEQREQGREAKRARAGERWMDDAVADAIAEADMER